MLRISELVAILRLHAQRHGDESYSADMVRGLLGVSDAEFRNLRMEAKQRPLFFDRASVTSGILAAIVCLSALIFFAGQEFQIDAGGGFRGYGTAGLTGREWEPASVETTEGSRWPSHTREIIVIEPRV